MQLKSRTNVLFAVAIALSLPLAAGWDIAEVLSSRTVQRQKVDNPSGAKVCRDIKYRAGGEWCEAYWEREMLKGETKS